MSTIALLLSAAHGAFPAPGAACLRLTNPGPLPRPPAPTAPAARDHLDRGFFSGAFSKVGLDQFTVWVDSLQVFGPPPPREGGGPASWQKSEPQGGGLPQLVDGSLSQLSPSHRAPPLLTSSIIFLEGEASTYPACLALGVI